jgi:hypothetical protein
MNCISIQGDHLYLSIAQLIIRLHQTWELLVVPRFLVLPDRRASFFIVQLVKKDQSSSRKSNDKFRILPWRHSWISVVLLPILSLKTMLRSRPVRQALRLEAIYSSTAPNNPLTLRLFNAQIHRPGFGYKAFSSFRYSSDIWLMRLK